MTGATLSVASDPYLDYILVFDNYDSSYVPPTWRTSALAVSQGPDKSSLMSLMTLKSLKTERVTEDENLSSRLLRVRLVLPRRGLNVVFKGHNHFKTYENRS